MKNIVWTRIDDRLIHGQVMTQWIQYTSANEVLIIDDAVARDSFLQMVMQSSVPKNIKLTVLSISEGIDYLNGEQGKEKIIILVKTPLTIDILTDAGVMIPSVNLGGIGAKAGRKQLFKNISISDEERKALHNLVDKKINVFIRVVTSDSEESVTKYL